MNPVVVFTAGDHRDNPPAHMTMGAAQVPDAISPNTDPALLDLVQDQKQDALWREKVLDLLTQLVHVQKEVAKSQDQVVQLLSVLETQVSPVQVHLRFMFSLSRVWFGFSLS